MGGICVCESCVKSILVYYVLHSPIKTLCPYCNDQEGRVDRCDYCDLPIRVQEPAQ